MRLPTSFFDSQNFDFGPLNLHSAVRAVPIRIPNRKQKQTSLSGMFCRILFIPKYFYPNRNRNRFVPVTFEFVIICDICDQNVTKSVLLKKLKKKQSVWPRSQIQNCDILWPSHISHFECEWYKTCFCLCLESGLERLWEQINRIGFESDTKQFFFFFGVEGRSICKIRNRMSVATPELPCEVM